MFQIVLRGEFGHYYMNDRKAFVFDADNAAKFATREAADHALACAKANGKKAMLARATVQSVH